MSFNDIDEVVVYLDLIYGVDPNFDLNDEQKFQPRCFKSHFSYDNIPKDAKYVLVYREPCAVVESHYRFNEKFLFEPGEITMEITIIITFNI